MSDSIRDISNICGHCGLSDASSRPKNLDFYSLWANTTKM